MITYILCPSCFCEIWALWVSWIIYNHLYMSFHLIHYENPNVVFLQKVCIYIHNCFSWKKLVIWFWPTSWPHSLCTNFLKKLRVDPDFWWSIIFWLNCPKQYFFRKTIWFLSTSGSFPLVKLRIKMAHRPKQKKIPESSRIFLI